MDNPIKNIHRDFVKDSTPKKQIIIQIVGPSTSNFCNLMSSETIASCPKAGKANVSKKRTTSITRTLYTAGHLKTRNRCQSQK